MKGNLDYTKPEASREEQSATPIAVESFKDKLTPMVELSISDIRSAYSATWEPLLEPDLFFIISGGEKREREYFLPLMDNTAKYKSLQIIFAPTTGINSGKDKTSHLGSSPDDIIAYWQEIYDKKRGVLSHNGREYELNNDIDHVFFLTDLDNFRSSLEQRKEEKCYCEWIIKKHIQGYRLALETEQVEFEWIISNPCFEIWLFYSFCDDAPTNHFKEIEVLDEYKRPAKTKSICDLVKKGGLDSRKALSYIERAITNANKFDPGEDEYKIPLLYGTQIRHLACKIWERIHTELPSQNKGADFKRTLQGGSHPNNPQ